MLTKPIYEILPIGYITIGTVSLLLLDQGYGLVSSLTVYIIGATIYNMRSQNRRTDPIRKRKAGKFPTSIYNYLPFAYLLLATVIFKLFSTGVGPVIAISLMTYSLYILIRRSSNRRHTAPCSQENPNF
ncbi:hypothetical protein [Shewanella sp. UCD-KL12]|uniref:hypothetical protein n=1 Tax=Shewanella sp. UCD-KL12 TaxID=1917163 RepID=UPI0009703727|nr:hypothetical protein [Shewanella sp. UCD-KL12]